MRTIFNVLGPLTNPAEVDAQVVGVYDPDLVEVVAAALARMDVERALVVHGSGLDEIAVHGETAVTEVDGEDIENYEVTPEDVGVDRHDISAVAGGEPAENAEYLRGIVTGEVTGAKRDIVLANAGAAIYVADEASSIADGVERARQCIESGQATTKMQEMCGQDSLEVPASD